MKASILLISSLVLLTSSFLVGCDPEPLTLTAENTEVVIAPGASPVVRFAAEEMTNFLSQVLGGPVKIVDAAVTLERDPPVDAKSVRVPVDAEALRVNKEKNPSSSDAVSHRVYEGSRVYIVLGTNSWSAAAGLHPEKLPRDSFLQLSTSTSSSTPAIFIAGCDDPRWNIYAALKNGECGEGKMNAERATLFGVYDFLERYADIRFYFPGPLGTIVPKKPSITVPVGERRESPDFIKRVWFSPGGEMMEGDDLGLGISKWEGRRVGFLQFLRLRRFAGTPMVHGVRHMQLRERFWKTHPEYFWASRTKDGKLVRHGDPKEGKYTHLCWTSGVLDEIYRDWVAYAKGLPPESRGFCGTSDGEAGDWPHLAYAPGLVNLEPDDGFNACQCDKCRAYYPNGETKGSFASKLIWSKTAEMANRLKKDGIPLLVTQDAYSFFRERPQGVTLPDNIVVCANYTGPWAEKNPKTRDHDFEEVKAWSALSGGAKIFLHNWALKYSRTKIPDLPCWSPRSVGSYFARVAPYAKGTYMESSSDRYSHVFLNCYILGKMTWDTSFDYNAAIDEHYALMYGPAAPEMKAFFDDLEDCWVGKVTAGKVEYNALGPIQRTPTKFEIWRTIYTEEKLAAWKRLFAEAKKKAEGLSARRVELMRRNVLEPVIRARKEFVDWTDAAKEEARRKREGIHNLLDREYAFDFYCPDEKAKGMNHETQTVATSKMIPFKFEPNTTYRLSFFLETEDVKPVSGYAFNGALIAVWSDRPQRYHFSFGTGAVVGSTAGRVHQSLTLKTTPDFQAHEIEVWLRGATGRMKVDGLILEKVK